MKKITIYHPALRRYRVRHIATRREYLIAVGVLVAVALLAWWYGSTL